MQEGAPKILNQDKMSKRTICNIVASGNINYRRRKNDGKQVIINTENSRNPFKSLSRVKYLFEKYERKEKSSGERKAIASVSISEQTPQL